MRYFLIGPWPPPLGGISVFSYRLAHRLRAEGHDVVIMDFENPRARKLEYVLRILFEPGVVCYMNLPYRLAQLALLLRPLPATIVFHDHNLRIASSLSRVGRVLFTLFFARASTLKFIAKFIKDDYESVGIPVPEKKLEIEHAFLPPPLEDEAKIWATYDDDVKSFVASHRPLIMANAFKIVFERGTDLYGLDMCVEMLAKVRKVHPNAGLLFGLAQVGEPAYFEEIKERIRLAGLSEHVRFLTGQKEIWPLFRRAQLMVRPTFVDGYGISIAEALHFGCPAVASDVCVRPAGTVTFRNRDVADFVEKCLAALS